MTFRFLSILVFLIISANLSLGQGLEKCGTVEYNRHKLGYSEKAFENWMNKKVVQKKLASSAYRTTETIYKIPVVVHVIHQGEAIGQASNIPEAQIISQLKILNDDYRRKNKDTVRTPSIFNSVAADVGVEFVLAKQDPDGAPTTGIVRVNGLRKSWAFDAGDDLKKVSFWPSEDYLNIWVAPLPSTLLGFAQFPVSDVLPGLDDASRNTATDGVVINYKFFGDGFNASGDSKGRTATHEIGHYLGLRHIWGDPDPGADGCNSDDYCNDTPKQDGPNYKCSEANSALKSCGSEREMAENYLDYSSDTCMNIFTQDQKTRIRTILENSPRRKSLLTSKSLLSPTIVSTDAAVSKITSPAFAICESTIKPKFVLRNMGTNFLSDVSITYSLNNIQVGSFNKTVDLNSYDTSTISLSDILLQEGAGEYELKIAVSNPNAGTDDRIDNDALSLIFRVAPSGSVPYTETFSSQNLNWKIDNVDQGVTWDYKEINTDKAAFIDFYNYTNHIGENDALISPAYDLTGYDSLAITFKVAYTYRTGKESDALAVIVSKDCGKTFSDNDILYMESGKSLATTAGPLNTAFVPTQTQWRNECIDISSYIGVKNFVFSLVAINGNGNNLYIDDVAISSMNCGAKVTAIADEIANAEIKIFPNPSPGKFTIDLSGMRWKEKEIGITVFSILGTEVFNKQVVNNELIFSLDLHEQSDGIYMLNLKSKSSNLTRRLIIKK